MLNGADVQNHARAAFQHARQQAPVESDGSHQIHVQRLLPVIVRQCGETAVGSVRSADAVDENIDAAPLLRDAVNDGLHTFGCADVRLHEHRWLLVLRKRGARGSRDRGAAQGEPAHDGFSHALRATGHQHPLAFELAGLSNARIRRSH